MVKKSPIGIPYKSNYFRGSASSSQSSSQLRVGSFSESSSSMEISPPESGEILPHQNTSSSIDEASHMSADQDDLDFERDGIAEIPLIILSDDDDYHGDTTLSQTELANSQMSRMGISQGASLDLEAFHRANAIQDFISSEMTDEMDMRRQGILWPLVTIDADRGTMEPRNLVGLYTSPQSVRVCVRGALLSDGFNFVDVPSLLLRQQMRPSLMNTFSALRVVFHGLELQIASGQGGMMGQGGRLDDQIEQAMRILWWEGFFNFRE